MPDVKVDFLRASSYGTASESSGQVQVQTTSDLGRWEEYHILLVSYVLLKVGQHTYGLNGR
jgi:hypoxanthine-guanine phosphoribosyltransferase